MSVKPEPVAELVGTPAGIEWFGVEGDTVVWMVESKPNGYEVVSQRGSAPREALHVDPTGVGGGVWINAGTIVWFADTDGGAARVSMLMDRTSQSIKTLKDESCAAVGGEWLSRRFLSAQFDVVSRRSMDGATLAEVKVDVLSKPLSLSVWTELGFVGRYQGRTVLFPWDTTGSQSVLSPEELAVLPYAAGGLLTDGSSFSAAPAIGTYLGGPGGAPVAGDAWFYCDTSCRVVSLAPATRGNSKVILKEFENVPHLLVSGEHLYFGTADSIWRVPHKSLLGGL